MSGPDSGPMDREGQLGRVAEELQLAIAGGEHVDVENLAQRFSVAADEVQQLRVALEVMHESLDDPDAPGELAPPSLPLDYELGDELGRGGMGIVYRAHQKSLNRDVAVKVLRPGDLQFGDAIQRFEREAKSLARLRHRHIVSVHEVGKADGFVYFTMDLIDGQGLSQLIDEGAMTNTRSVKLLRQVASAITYAHGQGVVHRDLKPHNILVDGEDNAFVVDFGLAQDLGGSREEVSARTMSGQMIGTPAYMSPEQALGDRERIGEAADIYALGAVLYECLTGRRPFHGLPLAKLMHAVIEDEPVPPRRINPRVPADLEVICQTAMHKRIDDRYPTVLAMAEDLERFSLGREIVARRRSLPQRLVRAAQRNRKQLTVAALPAVAILVLLWLLWLPGFMRDRDLAFGDRLLAEGNDEAALLAYRSAFDEATPGDIGDEARTHFAHCLINRAGRLQMRGEAGFEAERDRLLQNARDLLEPSVAASWQQFRHANTQQPELLHEWNRLLAFEDPSEQRDYHTALAADVRTRMIVADLDGPGRDATMVQLAADLGASRGGVLPSTETVAQALVDLVRNKHRLPPHLVPDLEQRARQLGFILHHRVPAYESGLVGIFRDRSQPADVRQLAGHLFHHLDVMPFALREIEQKAGKSMWHEPVFDDKDLADLAAAWDGMRGLDRTARYKKRMEFVCQRIAKAPAVRDLGEGQKSMHWDLRRWLARHAGTDRPGMSWPEWWQAHRSEDPRTWLARALGLDQPIEEITTKTVLQRWRTGPSRDQWHDSGYCHCLLTLLVDESFRLPRYANGIYGGSLRVRWERAVDDVPGDSYTLRIATLAIADGRATPELIWQKHVPLRLDEQQTWTEWTSPDLEQNDLRVGFGRQAWLLEARGGWRHQGSARLTWTVNGAEANVSELSQQLFYGSTNGRHSTYDSEVRVGEVTTLGVALRWPDQRPLHTETVRLAYLDRGADEAPWQLEQWRAALATTLEKLVARSARASHRDAVSAVTAATFLPLPEHIATLERLRNSGADNMESVYRAALLVAGDERAIAEPETPPTLEFYSPTFWIRLAQLTDDTAIRDYAWRKAEGGKLHAATAKTLLRAHAAGLPTPQWALDRARSAPGFLRLVWRSSWPAILGLAATLAIALAAGARMIRRRGTVSGRRSGVCFWFATLALANFSIWGAGTEWNPRWLGFGLHLIASFYVCWRAVPGWRWLVPPTWWTAATVAHVTADLEYEWLLWCAGVVLFLRLVSRRSYLQGESERRAREAYREAAAS